MTLADDYVYAQLEAQRAAGVERPVLYRKEVRWNSFGASHAVATGYHATAEEAERSAMELAVSLGWTARKWWQFWRWGEENY